ncbi:MAG: YicC/YloC family endoribonuclease [Lachnospiraceae bacterium]|nr:YicC/YloC family endoribonuclease [Lachnospiraceae bacterium]
MISSMTGFGRSERTTEDYKITVEMRSVNNRYLDLNIRMPKKFAAFENRIRQAVKNDINRGKVDIFITYETYGTGESFLKYNEALAAEYLAHLQALSKTLNLEDTIRTMDIARMPEVFTMSDAEVDENKLWAIIEEPLKEAVARFKSARIEEGEKLKSDLLGKLEEMKKYADRIEEREPEILREYREKLMAKVTELLEKTTIDESRIATEVVLYADKICTDEETVRLKSHIVAMSKELTAGGCIGRKLDFLAQEMNREANTILSKANDLETSDIGIALKTDIEKVREQIQNIE